jgi:hypothetical protein
VSVQKSTRFTVEQIGDMDDDQLLFWATQGKSVKVKPKPAERGVVPYDKSLTWAENVERFKRATAEAKNGKNR